MGGKEEASKGFARGGGAPSDTAWRKVGAHIKAGLRARKEEGSWSG